MNTIRHHEHDTAAAMAHHTLLTIDVKALAPALASLSSDDHAQQLQRLAQHIDSAATKERAKVVREQLEFEWRTKKQPMKAQAAPVGLFEQRQETLGI